MKTKLIILLSMLAIGSAATKASAAENARRYIYNGKGQLIAVVHANTKHIPGSTVASAGACSSCCVKKSS